MSVRCFMDIETALLDLNRGHYSQYPVNGHYHQHLDRFSSDDQRTLSMVLYLNLDWVAGDGGELRMHSSDKILKTFDINPISGRLVCFLSSSVSHEVMISHQVRRSFAGWCKRRA